MSAKSMNWHSWNMQKYMNSNTMILGSSPYCVYEWLSGEKVFYVGMGKHYRFTNVSEKSRSKEFMDIYRQGNCRVIIVACGMTELTARKIERETITACVDDGVVLVNKQYVIDYYHTPARQIFMERLKCLNKKRRGNIRQ